MINTYGRCYLQSISTVPASREDNPNELEVRLNNT